MLSAILIIAISLCLTGCSTGGAPKSPVGSFSYGSTSFELSNKGSFWFEHVASSDDQKHYTVIGTYTYSHDHIDEENEVSYGNIDITVTGLTLNDSQVQSLDFTGAHPGVDVAVGEKLLGWWYVTWWTNGGPMRLALNLPFRGYRAETYLSDWDWLIKGDPK